MAGGLRVEVGGICTLRRLLTVCFSARPVLKSIRVHYRALSGDMPLPATFGPHHFFFFLASLFFKLFIIILPLFS